MTYTIQAARNGYVVRMPFGDALVFTTEAEVLNFLSKELNAYPIKRENKNERK